MYIVVDVHSTLYSYLYLSILCEAYSVYSVAAYTVHIWLYSVKRTVYTVYNIHCTVYSCLYLSIQRSAYSVYSIRCTLYTVQCTVYIQLSLFVPEGGQLSWNTRNAPIYTSQHNFGYSRGTHKHSPTSKHTHTHTHTHASYMHIYIHCDTYTFFTYTYFYIS